jgi:hypothetical protein
MMCNINSGKRRIKRVGLGPSKWERGYRLSEAKSILLFFRARAGLKLYNSFFFRIIGFKGISL